MTRAPANLLAVRSLLLAELDLKPTSLSADLDPAEVGIVGDPNHRGGYHCGSDRLDADDYSVRESPRDKAGLTLDAAALDVGWFEVRSRGAVHTMRTFSTWCVNQCRANTPDSRDIREIIYSADGKSVKRWDRLGRRSTGDSSHLSHTHFSFFRDAVKAGRDQRPLFRRYLTEIGLLAGEDDDMTPEQDARLKTIEKWIVNLDGRTALGAVFLKLSGAPEVPGAKGERNGFSLTEAHEKLDALAATPPGSVVIGDEQLERVLRRVIGSVDGASPTT